jgi:phosphate transport system permease protein
MAADTEAATGSLGRVSRLRGAVFRNVTRVASAVGVVTLVLLVAYIALDAVQPFTAEPAWYLLFAGTVGVPSLLAAGYCWRRPAAWPVAAGALGATLAGVALAAVLVIWLGGGFALVLLVGVILPTAATVAVLAGRARALTIGLQTAGITVAGGGVASMIAVFLGTQATLVYAVTVGVPAAVLARFFLTRPTLGSVGARAVGAAVLGVGVAALGVEVAASLLAVDPGETTVGIYALGALGAVGAYGAVLTLGRRDGRLGLLAPFPLLAGALLGYLFHREFVVTAPAPVLLYGLTAALPAVAFAARVLTDRDEGRAGLALPAVAVLGVAVATAFHDRFVVLVPTAPAAFGVAIAASVGGYAWYVSRGMRDEGGAVDGPGAAGLGGLAVPVVVGGGLLAGLAAERWLDLAGPESWLGVDFLTRGSHFEPTLAGIHPALIGSLYLMAVVVFVAFPVGIGAAIYLEEYAPDTRWTRFLEVNIANLAGVPSVVYGLLGVAVFVRYGGLRLGAVVAGGFTLALLVLPIVIISSQEAVRAVPDSMRQASYGMGATRWQTVRNVVLPRALPGILTGTILALGRAIGETAPLIMVGLAAVGGVPDSLTGQGTAMPLQVFAWARDARELFRGNVAAAGAITLLVVLLATNAVAIIIRNRYQGDR